MNQKRLFNFSLGVKKLYFSIVQKVRYSLKVFALYILAKLKENSESFIPENEDDGPIPNGKIVVESHPNILCKSFHLNREISEYWYADFDRPLRPSSEEYLNQIGELAASLVKRLFKLQGIVSISVHPYEILIVFASAFDIPERVGRVTNVLKTIFPNPRKVIVEEK